MSVPPSIFIALISTLLAVDIISNLVSTIPADAFISSLTITPVAIAVAFPVDVMSPVKFALVVTVSALPLIDPVNPPAENIPLLEVIYPLALIFPDAVICESVLIALLELIVP